MAIKRTTLPTGSLPAALNHPQSALYINVSPGTFTTMVPEGIMPPPRAIGARRIWLKNELDEALLLLPKAPISGKAA